MSFFGVAPLPATAGHISNIFNSVPDYVSLKIDDARKRTRSHRSNGLVDLGQWKVHSHQFIQFYSTALVHIKNHDEISVRVCAAVKAAQDMFFGARKLSCGQ